MTSVVGLVLVAMTGLTITNHHRNQNTATGKSLEPNSDHPLLLLRRPDGLLPERNAKELELALAKEDEALWASFERYEKKHPKNVKKDGQRRGPAEAAAAAAVASTDPMVNSVYSLHTKSELTATVDEAAEFKIRRESVDEDPSRPGAIAGTTKATGGDAVEATTDGQQRQPQGEEQEQERPFDFYDPSLTAAQKREYVKKVDYFSPY